MTKMSMQEYLDLPAFSASLICDILDKCPAAARFNSPWNPNRVRKDTALTDGGSIAHAILLEGSEACCVVIDPNNHPAEKTGAIPEGWTNKSIRAARDAVREAGKIPILSPAMAEIRAMVTAAQAFIASLADTEPAIYAAFMPHGGESEVTLTWSDGQTPCKMRPDRTSKDHRLIVDAKFTSRSAEPDAWGRSAMIGEGHYIHAAFYRRGIEALFNVSPDYVYLVTETEPPYLSSLVGVDPHAFELGGQKVSLGLQEWEACVKNNKWPGYPPIVLYPEIPAWLDAAWEQQQMENPFLGKE